MATLQRVMSRHPVPDWLRPHGSYGPTEVVSYQPFEAPPRSLSLARPVEPSLLWAIQAIETLKTNRARFRRHHTREVSRKKADAPTVIEIGPIPAWVAKAAALPELSFQSTALWLELIDAMIRDQLPYFHLNPDWRRVAHDNGGERSVAQREILKLISNEVVLVAVGCLRRITDDRRRSSLR